MIFFQDCRATRKPMSEERELQIPHQGRIKHANKHAHAHAAHKQQHAENRGLLKANPSWHAARSVLAAQPSQPLARSSRGRSLTREGSMTPENLAPRTVFERTKSARTIHVRLVSFHFVSGPKCACVYMLSLHTRYLLHSVKLLR